MAVQQRKQAKVIAKQQKAQRRIERKRQVDEMAQKMAETKQQKKLEQQGIHNYIKSFIIIVNF